MPAHTRARRARWTQERHWGQTSVLDEAASCAGAESAPREVADALGVADHAPDTASRRDALDVRDGPTPGRLDSHGCEELWAFDGVPASLADMTNPADIEIFRLTPTTGRIACRIFTIRPQGGSDAEADREWAARMDYAETDELAPATTPWMHRTPTIDLIVVLSGAMDLILDGGDEVHLQPGDSVVQRGTMHAWRNTGAEPCLAVAFMVRAQ